MRIKNLTLLLFSLLLVSACLKKESIKDKAFITKDVLVEVLTEIHLIDGITEDRKYYRKYNFNDSIDLMSPVFEKHNITREQFDTTIAEYSRYPELLDKVYDEVIMKLNLMLDENDEQNEEPAQHAVDEE
jgi:hypothetical protein